MSNEYEEEERLEIVFTNAAGVLPYYYVHEIDNTPYFLTCNSNYEIPEAEFQYYIDGFRKLGVDFNNQNFETVYRQMLDIIEAALSEAGPIDSDNEQDTICLGKQGFKRQSELDSRQNEIGSLSLA